MEDIHHFITESMLPSKHLTACLPLVKSWCQRAILALVAAFGWLALAISPASAQLNGAQLWQEVQTPKEVSRNSAALNSQGHEIIVPASSRAFSRDKAAMDKLLAQAPSEIGGPDSRAAEVEIVLPRPDGQLQRFKVKNSPIMSAELAARFPDIKSYTLQGVDDPTASGRLDTSPEGFRAMILSGDGTYFIDPHWQQGKELSICYAKKDLQPSEKGKEWTCEVPEAASPTPTPVPASGGAQRKTSNAARPTGDTIRIYRAAIAATTEYTAFHGGTFGGALAAINTTLNRVNAVFEREFSVRFQLVAPLIYVGVDPYTNGDLGKMLTENQTNIDAVVGDANYDIGHVFGTGGGGVVSGLACQTGTKARGVSCSSRPTGDSFDVDLVCHEIGHQFSASHTFTAADQGTQFQSRTAYEPASGSTIMSYAGIANQSIQISSDDYFHVSNYDQIDNFITTGFGSLTPYQLPTANRPPVIVAPSQTSYTIPVQTPFALTVQAFDLDLDQLTYCWEQFDRGLERDWSKFAPADLDDGVSPIFRSYPPSPNRTRFFPSLTYILNNTNTPPVTYSRSGINGLITGEVLPTKPRTMNFRVSVRDNRAGGGGQDWLGMQVTTTLTAGPFRVTSHNTPTNIPTDTPFTVTWDPANTFAPPVACSSVNILFSTDGGQTFPTLLAGNAPNTGSATITVPKSLATAAGRIKIEGSGNIFFDINDADLRSLPDSSSLFGQLTDRGPPTIRVTSPRKSPSSTTNRQIILRGSASDNIKLSRLQYRLKGPDRKRFGEWRRLPLNGDPNRQDWVLPITLKTRGEWLIQVRSRDAVGYVSRTRTLAVTRN